jgi:hypothetical protein
VSKQLALDAVAVGQRRGETVGPAAHGFTGDQFSTTTTRRVLLSVCADRTNEPAAKRRVALKVLKPEFAAVLGADRFVQEITTTMPRTYVN